MTDICAVNIPGHENILKIEAINKGWSGDKKYYVEENGVKYLLRIIALFGAQEKAPILPQVSCGVILMVNLQ